MCTQWWQAVKFEQDKLQNLYRNKYSGIALPSKESIWMEWTEQEMEADLQHLKEGEIEDFVKDTGLEHAMDQH